MRGQDIARTLGPRHRGRGQKSSEQQDRQTMSVRLPQSRLAERGRMHFSPGAQQVRAICAWVGGAIAQGPHGSTTSPPRTAQSRHPIRPARRRLPFRAHGPCRALALEKNGLPEAGRIELGTLTYTTLPKL